jgi:hypothetical protein
LIESTARNDDVVDTAEKRLKPKPGNLISRVIKHKNLSDWKIRSPFRGKAAQGSADIKSTGEHTRTEANLEHWRISRPILSKSLENAPDFWAAVRLNKTSLRG